MSTYSCPQATAYLHDRPLEGDEKKLADSMLSSIIRPSPSSISLGFAALNTGNTPDPKQVEPSNYPADDLIAGLPFKMVKKAGGIIFTQWEK